MFYYHRYKGISGQLITITMYNTKGKFIIERRDQFVIYQAMREITKIIEMHGREDSRGTSMYRLLLDLKEIQTKIMPHYLKVIKKGGYMMSRPKWQKKRLSQLRSMSAAN